MISGYICLVYAKSSYLNFKILNPDLTDCLAESAPYGTALYSSGAVAVGYNSNTNSLYFLQNVVTTSYLHYILYRFYYEHLVVSVANAKIDGILLEPVDTDFLERFISATESLSLAYCALKNAVCTSDADCNAVYTADPLTISRCVVCDNDKGIFAQANTVSITDSQFYGNSLGYAIDIDGAAASSGDITVEHCDIFDNYGSIHLENNNGTNEIIKNNILYDNALGIDAENDVDLSYSVCTDTHVSATSGASVLSANPLYLNEGYLDEDDLDLNIKIEDLGYHATSPAYDLADDDRNAGAYDVKYIGTVPSWSSITLDKPDGFDGVIESVKIINQKDNGTTSSRLKGRTETIKLKWSAIPVADWDELDALIDSGASEVRLYPDPTTHAADYDTYSIEYADLKCSPKYWRLSDRGNQDVELILSRKYERV
jgi:hypothetical protein